MIAGGGVRSRAESCIISYSMVLAAAFLISATLQALKTACKDSDIALISGRLCCMDALVRIVTRKSMESCVLGIVFWLAGEAWAEEEEWVSG